MFHKEGAKIILIATTLTVAILLLSDQFISVYWIQKTVQILTLGFLILILQFFRNPVRNVTINDNHIIAPVDGKVVVNTYNDDRDPTDAGFQFVIYNP